MGFYAYFASRFPNLLLAVHEFARKSDAIVNDQIFLKYFGDEEQLQEGNESWKDLKKLARDQKKESSSGKWKWKRRLGPASTKFPGASKRRRLRVLRQNRQVQIRRNV